MLRTDGRVEKKCSENVRPWGVYCTHFLHFAQTRIEIDFGCQNTCFLYRFAIYIFLAKNAKKSHGYFSNQIQIFSLCKMDKMGKKSEFLKSKEDSRDFAISNVFEQWKICCLNWKFLLKMESLVSIEDETRYHFVSLEIHKFEIDSTMTPTMKIFCMKDK